MALAMQLGDVEARGAERERLAGLIRAFAPHDGRFALRVPGVHVARYSKVSTELIHSVPRPILCIVAQGAKTIGLGRESFAYDASRLLVLSVDLPVTAQVTRASASEPYLGVVLDLNTERMASAVLRVFPHGLPRNGGENRGVCVTPSGPEFTGAAVRLLELMGSPEDAALLAPLVMDEILIRLLRTPVGARVAQIGLAGSHTERVGRAIQWLREHYAQPVKVAELAGIAHMSASSFHSHFKAVTSMSPLDYQKAMRLQEARRLMLCHRLDAGGAARQVGYLSASQFSREYARYFGSAPGKDIARMAAQGLTAEDVLR